MLEMGLGVMLGLSRTGLIVPHPPYLGILSGHLLWQLK